MEKYGPQNKIIKRKRHWFKRKISEPPQTDKRYASKSGVKTRRLVRETLHIARECQRSSIFRSDI